MSERHVVRCEGRTLRGTRCSRRTAKTRLCFQHLEKQKHLRVKPSTIPNSGFGLFTTKRRHKREVIAPYSGRTVINNDPDYGGDYVLQTKTTPPYKYIDANKTSDGAGRYSNMARRGDGKVNNSQLSVSTRYNTANVVAKRPIPKDREVLTDYGRQYWI